MSFIANSENIMFELPSMPNLIISTLVFIVATWQVNRFFDTQSISKSTARSLSVFALAYLLSWGSGEAVDWTIGTPAVAQIVGGLN
ncbi:MAG: hypothetical protein WAT12_04535 [Candidatus Nitrotoga sp.]